MTGVQTCALPISSGFAGSGLTRGVFAQKVLAHATAGGTLSVLQGGKFGHGFVSAGITEAVSPTIDNLHNDFAQVAASAIVGGSTSVIAGGKFGNGAMTGAFQMAFNKLQHDETNEMDGEFTENDSGADANMFSEKIDPELHDYAASFPDKKGYFYAAFHSIADSSRFQYVAGSHLYKDGSPSQLWNKIIENPRYTRGDVIVLLSCSAGSSGLARGLVEAARENGIAIRVISSTTPIIWRRTTSTTKQGTHVWVRKYQKFYEGKLNSDYSVTNTGRNAKWEVFK